MNWRVEVEIEPSIWVRFGFGQLQYTIVLVRFIYLYPKTGFEFGMFGSIPISNCYLYLISRVGPGI